MAAKKKRLCRECGVSIHLRSENARFCKKCANKRLKEVRRLASKAYRKKWRKENPEKNRNYMRGLNRKKKFILNYFKKKFNCSTVPKLYEKVKEMEYDDI